MSVYVLLGRKDSMEAILEVECRYKLIDAYKLMLIKQLLLKP